MEITKFNNRVFGAVILKSINSNFNADFTHHPRTLPDGVVYSTDKALKYAIKDYFRKTIDNKKLFYVKRYNEKMNPLSLDDTFRYLFGKYPKAPIEKFSLFYFDGESSVGVLPKPKKKQITDYFKSIEDNLDLIGYKKIFENLANKDIKNIKIQELQNISDEEAFYFAIDKEDKIIKVEGHEEQINIICKELDSILTGGIDKFGVLRDLLKCIDIRLFGATYAGETNISIHGPVQINHGVNKFPENDIYTEDILSPFRNPGKEGSDEKGMSTIGNQTNLKEGHYVFHFSINPKNTKEFYDMLNEGKSDAEKMFLSNDDINKFKNAVNNSVTALDSSRKMGTENEVTLWIQLKDYSMKVLPSLTELITVRKNDGKIEIQLAEVNKIINQVSDEIEKVEVYYNPVTSEIKGLEKTEKIVFKNILNENEI